ncbi:uncharacterized protein TRIADDRAFT_22316, partial [Trichoplax adhaerens]
KLLRDPEIQRNKAKYGLIIRKVIACMTLGMDVSSLFGEMTMAAATDDLIQKKLVYMYICRYVDRFPDLAVLTINTLQKDCKDNSAIVRSLALRSLCSLRLSNLIEYIREPLLNGLTDDNYYVRKTAVMGCASISQFSPKLIKDLGIIDKLYAMLNDPHPLVISNCVVALDEIMVEEGGIAINRNIANYLLNNLRHFNEWSQCYILDILNRYKPSSEEEICDILNLIDDRLQQGNSGVVFSAAKLFLTLTEYFKDIRDHVFRRLKEPILTVISAGRPELAHVCLKHIELLLNQSPQLFSNNCDSFFFRYNDPNYIKLQKLNILRKITTPNNANNVINELSSYITDIDITIAREAIICMGQIALQVTECCEYCIQKLLSLLSLEIDFVTSHTLRVIKDILRKYPWLGDMVAPEIDQLDDISQDPDGKCALIWMLGELGEIIEKSPYLLEEIIENVEEESSSVVKLHLMTAAMKLFFKRPPECIALLGRLLEHIINEESDVDVRDRGLFYYRLLNHDINKVT